MTSRTPPADQRKEVIESLLGALFLVHEDGLDLNEYRGSLGKSLTRAWGELCSAPLPLPAYKDLHPDGRVLTEIFNDIRPGFQARKLASEQAEAERKGLRK